MTDQDIYDLLIKIDNGYSEVTEIEKAECGSIEIIHWNKIKQLPKCIGLLSSLKIFCLVDSEISDISPISGLTSLTSLDLSRNIKLRDIKALSNLTNLKKLALSDTLVSDISPLSGLSNLTNLDLNRTGLRGISSLSGLKRLTTLDLSETYVCNISVLAGLECLTDLYLADTMVYDIGALSNLSDLKCLLLCGTLISDINALSGLTNLKHLDLRNTAVNDISPIIGLTNLTELNISGTNVVDISPLSGLTNLIKLDLSGNRSRDKRSPLKNIDALKGLIAMEDLNLASTNVSNVSVLSNMNKLKRLDLSGNGFWGSSLKDISVLTGLIELEYLRLDYTSVRDITPLQNLKRIVSLSLRKTQIGDISALSYLSTLTNLDLQETRISDISPLASLKNITNLNLSRNINLRNIGGLSELKNLTTLDLCYTRVENIGPLSGLTRLTSLDLSRNVKLEDISPLSRLTNLTTLDLRYLKIKSIPDSLLKLNIEFIPDEKPIRPGIYIFGLSTIEQPIEIFFQNRELIRAYYDEQLTVPLNECKVIFLGDAESGKTHSIKRLLSGGAYLSEFDGNATPGIDITVSSVRIDGTDILINYWDFGGQEIQHSMHRMFLTKRTVYVVFLNARQDPLDERARYWIENINSFAPDAPVLIVINKIDQNDQPKFNEDGIKASYKDKIKKVIRMSALADKPDVFLERLQGSINGLVKELSTIKTKIPKTWKTLMESIREMPEYYMTTEEFQEKCLTCNVSDYKKIHDDLVDLFQVIGVSFCYYTNRATADYLLLNPIWIVNAIYTIVSNSEIVSNNGVITQADLYDLLQEDLLNGAPIKRVYPNLRYKGIEVNYILGVIRMFRLSYQLKDGSEFFPMLCDGNEKISLTEIVSAKALHFIFQYTYLPAIVMHRLIVEMQTDLDYRYVWYSGAVFRDEGQSQKAYVYFEGNKLHIYVESEDTFYNPNEYLMQFKKHVRTINAEMGLSAEEYVTYQEDNKETVISFKKIKGNLDNSLFFHYDEILDKVIDYRVAAHRYENRNPIIQKKILRRIIKALGAMQDDPTYYSKDTKDNHDLEDSRNRFVSHILRTNGHECSDQQTGGSSTNGGFIGERDILIRDEDNQPILIYEGLNLKYVDKTDIGKHLGKLLKNYNPQGLPYGVLTTYLECDREKFFDFVNRYRNYISEYAPGSFECIGSPINLPMTEGQFLSCIEMTYACGKDKYFVIYHIVVRIAR